MDETINKESYKKKIPKDTRENIILRDLFLNNEFLIRDWNKKKEIQFSIPKSSLYNLIKSLKSQNIIIIKSLSPKRATFTPQIKDLLLIIEENKEISLIALTQDLKPDIENIIDRLVDAKIIEKFIKGTNVYLKIYDNSFF